MTTATPKRRFDFYPLEERILLSGDALDGSDVAPEAEAAEYLQFVADATADGEVLEDPEASGQQAASTDVIEHGRIELVIIDSSVKNSETLLANLRASAATGSEIQWIVCQLDPDRDGVEQISAWLDELALINAIHLISGGDGEGLLLGNSRLDLDTAAGYAGQITLWSQSLQADADVLIYGSNLASTEDGRGLLETLAILCDCDVAASDNPTGHGSLGGDWQLEYVLGEIQADIFLAIDGQEQWQHVLQVSSAATLDEMSVLAESVRQELVFVDMSVSNYEQLVDDLLNRDGSQYIVWLLNSDSDGVLQISEALKNFGKLDAVHIVSHGTSAGAMQLGSTWLSLSNLGQYGDEISGWGAALNAGADLLIYGCDVAASADGREMLQRLAGLTGADVAASADGTGHASFGANWQFEFSIGVLEAQQAFSDALQEAWLSVLALQTVRDEFSSISYSNNNGTQLWSGSWVETDASGGGASSGNIYISTGRLYVTAHTTGNNIYRQADLSSALDATFSFSYSSGLGASATIYAQVSSDGGSTFTTLSGGIFSAISNTGAGSRSFDISSYMAANTVIRFLVVSGETGAGNNQFYVDDVQIAYNTNTAPVLNPAAPTYNTNEDAAPLATTVATLVGSTISDTDPGAQQGIAVTALAGSGGTLRYSLDGGTTWQAVSSVSSTNALLLRSTDLIQFVPDPYNGGTMTADYRAWDRTSGTAGGYADTTTNGGTTAFSTATDRVTISSASINDAPILDNSGSFELGAITEDATSNGGQSVASILASSGGNPITDVDNGSVEGIAITAANSANGLWEYSLDGGTTWSAVGAISTTSSLLLRDTDLIRFAPNGENGTTADFAFRAWDRTNGAAGSKVDTSTSGGTTAFSVAQATASISVADVNDAPVLSGANDLAAIDEDPTANPGTSILALISGHVTDVDTGALAGIAVTGVDDTDGTWQYSLDAGVSWTHFGTVSESAARLLADDASTLIRFVPAADWNGVTTIQFRAWDQTQGANGGSFNITTTGGTTAFSADTGTSSLTVNPVNDAPVIALQPGDSQAETILEADGGLTTQGTLSVTDVDAPDTVLGSVTDLVVSGIASGLQSDHTALLGMLNVTHNVISSGNTTGFLEWVFDSGAETFDYLAVGESLTLTYTVTATDDQAASDTQEITITINGTNDAPVISLEAGDSDGATVGVTGATLIADGTLSASDLDRSDEATAAITGFSKSGETTGLTLSDAQLEALLAINASVISDTQQTGLINWSFDSDGYTFGYLGLGETLTLVYTFTVTDSQATTDTHDVTIVITGDNSAPIISVEPGDRVDETLIETDAGLSASGTLSVSDANTTDIVLAEASTVVSSGTTSGMQADSATLLAMLTVNTTVIDGVSTAGTLTWDFDSGSEAFDYLAVGESLTLTYTITVTDSAGATDSQDITITITGTNDAPVTVLESGDSDGDTLAANGASLTTSGEISVVDLDRSDDVSATISGFAKSGDVFGLQLTDADLEAMLGINPAIVDGTSQDGSITWLFDSDGETFAYLADGEALTLIYTVTVTDTQGATSNHDVTVIITGTNTPPEIVLQPGDSASEALIETDSGLSVSGTLSVHDANISDVVIAQVSSLVSSGTTAGLQPDHTALMAMLSVDANVIDGVSTSGSLAWEFDSGAEAFNYLAVGETLVLTYTVMTTDSTGASDHYEITISISGANDAPVVTLEPGDSDAESLAATGSALTGAGTLTAEDRDRSDEVTAAVTGFSKMGDLVGLSATDAELQSMLTVDLAVIDSLNQQGAVHWQFDSTDETFGYLADGEALTLVYTVTVTDSHGASDSRDVTIVVHGTNTPPIFSIEPGDSAGETLIEANAALQASGTLTVSDANVTDTVSASVSSVIASGTTAGLQPNNAALLAMLTINSSVIDAANSLGSIAWGFDSAGEAFDYLAAGESLVLTYTLTATDSHGAIGTQEVTFTINGTNDLPVIVLEAGDVDQVSVIEDTNTIISAGSMTVHDVDRTDQVSAAVTGLIVSGETAGMTSNHAQLLSMLSVTPWIIDATEQSDKLNWTFNSGAEVFSHLWTGRSLTLQYAITVTDSQGANTGHQVVITIHGDNEFPLAVADAYSVRTGETLAVGSPGPLANDSDPDGNPLTVVLVSGPSHGSLTIAANGSFTYIPNGGFVGTDKFRYRASDGRLTSAIVEVSINVTAPSSSGGSGDSPPSPPPSSVVAPPVNPGEPMGFGPEEPIQNAGEAAVEPAVHAGHKSSQTETEIELSAVRTSFAGDHAYMPVAHRSAENEQITVGLLPRLAALNNFQQRYIAMQELRDDLANAIVWSATSNDDSNASLFGFGLGAVIIGSPGAAAGVVTAGYILWAARGAALLATLATSMPAWRNLDPSTLLADYRASQGNQSDDDELESMIGR